MMGSQNGYAKSSPEIHFEISFPEAQAHYVDVTMTMNALKGTSTIVKMPVWAPGSYLVREFAKNVEGFKAQANGNVIKAEKISKNAWRIHHNQAASVKISYRVYAFEISVRTSFVDAAHAFLSPTGIFLYPEGHLNAPSTVKIIPYKNWNTVSTGLESKGDQFTLYAPDFDILFDSPIEVGNQDVFTFNVEGVLHEVAMVGGGNYDKERLKTDMTKIIKAGTAIFGENPNKRYVFIVHNYASGGGGLEHLNSTVLGASRYAYTDETSYKKFLGLVAHEYFHIWNVKRLRPYELGPFNYDQENYTTNLWIAEGFTAYYDNLLVRRAGIFSPENYLDELIKTINIVENQPGNKVLPLSEASFDAWVKLYRPNENTKNSSISYYDKGSLMAMLLDLEIIHQSKGTRSLDDVMKNMYDEFYKKKNRGFTTAEFKAGLEKVAGIKLDNFYEQYIDGVKAVDYNKYFAYAGLKLRDVNAQRNAPSLGITFSNKDGKFTVANVIRNSTAWTDGINVNDELIAIDGVRISSIDRILHNKKVGDKLMITISRDGQIMDIPVTLKRNDQVNYMLEDLDQVSEDQSNVLKKWLSLN